MQSLDLLLMSVQALLGNKLRSVLTLVGLVAGVASIIAVMTAIEAEGRLLKPKWWLDPTSKVGDVTFRPKKVTPRELEELCLDARRQFYSWSSMGRRLLDRQANLKNLTMLAVYLGLNLQAHFDIDLRQGLQLGAGLAEWEPHASQERQRPESAHAPVSV